MDASLILAQATVDTLRGALPGIARGTYRVTVTGKTSLGLPLPRRVYDAEARDQDAAASGCIDLYVKEFTPPKRPDGELIH